MMKDDDLRGLLESPIAASSDSRRVSGALAAAAASVLVVAVILVFVLVGDTAQETSPTDERPPATAGAESSTTTTLPDTPEMFPSARVHAQAAFDSGDKAIVHFGGQTWRVGPPPEGTWVFDINSGSWHLAEKTASEPDLRVGHAMTYVGSLDGVLMYGGGEGRYLGSGCPITYCPVTLLADTWLFTSGAWQNLDPAGGPGLRYGHSMAYDSESDRVVLFGGLGLVPEFADEPAFLQETWVYDPNNNSWDEIDSDQIPSARSFSQMVYHPGTDLIYLFGGMSEQNAGEDDLWTFDVDAEEWRSIATEQGPTGRWMHQMALDGPSGNIYIFGGQMRVDKAVEGGSVAGVEITDEAWFFDSETATWRAEPFLPRPMFAHAADGAERGVIAWVGGGLYQYDTGVSDWITLAEPE